MRLELRGRGEPQAEGPVTFGSASRSRESAEPRGWESAQPHTEQTAFAKGRRRRTARACPPCTRPTNPHSRVSGGGTPIDMRPAWLGFQNSLLLLNVRLRA
eukprot:6064591-Alexandrium_andersonii.AAC.1